MTIAERFCRNLMKECGVKPGDHVLAAVSGGADSVALLRLLCVGQSALGLTVSCAHMEHGIRGESALADMCFVRALCEENQIPFYAERADVPAYAKAQGMGIEEAARTLRYAFLERIAKDIGAAHIALAHHAQDQAETVLLHAARGSDVRGLCAMRCRRGNIVRPLLGETPKALREYLQGIGQSWREDETNGDLSYARNRIRAQVIAGLETAYPGATQALCRLAQAAQRDESYFDALLGDLPLSRRSLVDGTAFVKSEWSSLPDALLGRLLARELDALGFGIQDAQTLWAIMEAIRAGGDAVVNLTGGAHAYVDEEHLFLIRAACDVAQTPLKRRGETHTPFGVFTVREALEDENGDGITSQAMDEELLWGSTVTVRRKGDALVPFGRHSPVKLKKLMIDAGVPRPIRNSLPVIRNGDRILWAVTLRPGELCRAQGGKRLLVTYTSQQE